MRKPILHQFYTIVTILLSSCEQEVDFAQLPVVSTTKVSSVSYYSVQSGGVITADGGYDIIACGVCWSTSLNPDIKDSKTVDAAGTGTFESSIENLLPGTTYYLRAYATNKKGTSYGLQETFTTKELTLVELTTTDVIKISDNSAFSGGKITHDGGAPVDIRGVCWSTSQNPTVSLSTKTADGSGTGTFISKISGLQPGTTYYLRAYSTNSVGTSYGNEIIFSTIKTVISLTGRVWMDRNLGANRVATSSTDTEAYGDLYQWGRETDGHEKRNSSITSTLSISDTPGHGNFITVNSGNYDWRSSQNNTLWQGVNGINNPCPEGFRIPTAAEWEAERASWDSNNSVGAFDSPLKLPVTGHRDRRNGSLLDVGSFGFYWSGTVDHRNAQSLYFFSFAGISSLNRSNGHSVRCIKD